MGTREAPGADSHKRIRVRRLPWFPARPEAASGLPMHGVSRRPPGHLCGLGVSVVDLYL